MRRSSPRSRTALAAVAGITLLLSVPASAATIGGVPIAEPGGPCRTGYSVPLSGLYNQIYTCVADTWTVASDLGTPGPAGPKGDQGDPGPALTVYHLKGSGGVTLDTIARNVFGTELLTPAVGTYTINWWVNFAGGVQPMEVACDVLTSTTATLVSTAGVVDIDQQSQDTLAGGGWITVTGGDPVTVECRDQKVAPNANGAIGDATLILTPVAGVIN